MTVAAEQTGVAANSTDQQSANSIPGGLQGFADNSTKQQPTPGETLSQLIRHLAAETLDMPNPQAWQAIMAKLEALNGLSPARRWRLRQMVWEERYFMQVERRAARK